MTDDDRPAGTDTADERVRSCLLCGAIIPFEASSCPTCGQPVDAPVVEAPRPHEPCPGCDVAVDATLIFCPRCGVERPLRPVTASAAPLGPDVSGVGRSNTFAFVVALLGPATLLAATLAVYLYRS